MVPDKFNMVDMNGIDIITAQGQVVTGLYQKLVESIAQCRYQCLYNWKFDGILIPPTNAELVLDNDTGNVKINEGIEVDEDDVVHVYTLVAPPVIEPVRFIENGEYDVPPGVDGYNPVTVSVPPTIPQYEPVPPLEFGLCTAYQYTNGDFYSYNTENQCLYLADIESGANYVVFLPNEVGSRFRVGLWEGKTYSDFEPYLHGQTDNRVIYSGSTVVTGSSDLSGNGLTRRFFFTGVDGIVIIGTSNTGQTIRPILLKINS